MLIQPNHAYSCLGYKKVFNVLVSRIGQKASWPIMRNMETFSSKQMFCWINSFSSLIEENCWCPLTEDYTCRSGERGLLGNTQCLLCKSSKTFDQFNKNILIVSYPWSSSHQSWLLLQTESKLDPVGSTVRYEVMKLCSVLDQYRTAIVATESVWGGTSWYLMWLGQKRALMLLYIEKSRDLVRCYRWLKDSLTDFER